MDDQIQININIAISKEKLIIGLIILVSEEYQTLNEWINESEPCKYSIEQLATAYYTKAPGSVEYREIGAAFHKIHNNLHTACKFCIKASSIIDQKLGNLESRVPIESIAM